MILQKYFLKDWMPKLQTNIGYSFILMVLITVW